MLHDLVIILANLIPGIVILGLIICIPLLKKMPLIYKWLFFYLLLALTFDLLGRLLGHLYGNNLALIPLYSFFELLFFTKFFVANLFKGKTTIVASVLGAIGCSYIVYELFTSNLIDPQEFQSYSRAVDAFLIVVFAMIYFFEKLTIGTNPNEKTLQLNTILLVFFSLHLILFLPINFIVNASLNFKFFFLVVNLLLTITFYSLLILLIWKNGRIQKRSPSGLQ